MIRNAVRLTFWSAVIVGILLSVPLLAVGHSPFGPTPTEVAIRSVQHWALVIAAATAVPAFGFWVLSKLEVA